jgi:ribosome-associated translation inhibitor RaiA
MHVQLNTDHNIKGNERLEDLVRGTVEAHLERFANRVTRVEVHLKDANRHKGGDSDKHCTMEARVNGLKPIAVNHHAGNVDEAYEGAAAKLERSLDNTFGRLSDTSGR